MTLTSMRCKDVDNIVNKGWHFIKLTPSYYGYMVLIITSITAI